MHIFKNLLQDAEKPEAGAPLVFLQQLFIYIYRRYCKKIIKREGLFVKGDWGMQYHP